MVVNQLKVHPFQSVLVSDVNLHLYIKAALDRELAEKQARRAAERQMEREADAGRAAAAAAEERADADRGKARKYKVRRSRLTSG